MRLPDTRLVRSVAALALTCSLLCGVTLAHAAQAIVVGQAIDLSGPDSAISRDYVAGIKTYFDAINAAGGINGRKIKYIVRDDQGQAELTAKISSELLDHDQADVLVGGVGEASTETIINTESFKRSGQVLFAPLANGSLVTDNRVLYWRPSYQQELQHIFEHFANTGQKQLGIVVQDGADNREALAGLTEEIKKRGLKITGTAHIGRNGENAASEAKKLSAGQPGFVIVISDTIGTGLFLREFRKYDTRTFVAGTSLTNLSTLAELAGPKAVEWTVFSQVVPNPSGSSTVIQMEHLNNMRKYRDESVSSLTLEGYAVAKALGKVFQQAKRGQRIALRDMFGNGMDLGGLQVVYNGKNNRLSGYVDIALFRKGSELVF